MSRLKVWNADTSEWEYVNAPGGSQTLCYEFTVDHTTFPAGGEIVPTGIDLAVGDRIIDIGISVTADNINGADFTFGQGDLAGAKKVAGIFLDGNDPNDGGPYSGAISGHLWDIQGPSIVDGQSRLPCTVLTAHELVIACTDQFVAPGSCVVSVYVIRAASVVTLPTPVPTP